MWRAALVAVIAEGRPFQVELLRSVRTALHDACLGAGQKPRGSLELRRVVLSSEAMNSLRMPGLLRTIGPSRHGSWRRGRCSISAHRS